MGDRKVEEVVRRLHGVGCLAATLGSRNEEVCEIELALREGVRAGLELAAEVAEESSIPIPLDEWSSRKRLSAATALGIAAAIRALAGKGGEP